MSPRVRQQVRERAGGRCEYCHLPDWLEFSGPFHVEHVTARQHRGSDNLSNLAWACSRCNAHKGTNLTAVDPDTTNVVRLFNPRQEQWSKHFALEGVHLLGLTATGRATAWLLQVNAERRLELRAELITAGLW